MAADPLPAPVAAWEAVLRAVPLRCRLCKSVFGCVPLSCLACEHVFDVDVPAMARAVAERVAGVEGERDALRAESASLTIQRDAALAHRDALVDEATRLRAAGEALRPLVGVAKGRLDDLYRGRQLPGASLLSRTIDKATAALAALDGEGRSG